MYVLLHICRCVGTCKVTLFAFCCVHSIHCQCLQYVYLQESREGREGGDIYSGLYLASGWRSREHLDNASIWRRFWASINGDWVRYRHQPSWDLQKRVCLSPTGWVLNHTAYPTANRYRNESLFPQQQGGSNRVRTSQVKWGDGFLSGRGGNHVWRCRAGFAIRFVRGGRLDG